MKYLLLGFEVFNAVIGMIALVKTPAAISPQSVRALVDPVLQEVETAAKLKINMALADQIITDAANTLKAALTHHAGVAPTT